MAPKRKPTASSGAQPKKQRSVLTLNEKLAVLWLLRDNESVSNLAHKYGRNIIYREITGCMKKRVLCGRFKGFSMVILTIRNVTPV
jgi:hypothetical protein